MRVLSSIGVARGSQVLGFPQEAGYNADWRNLVSSRTLSIFLGCPKYRQHTTGWHHVGIKGHTTVVIAEQCDTF